MKLIKTKISGPKIIKSKIFKDSRGFLKEVYQKRVIPNLNFPFDVMSYSKKNVLRGLHIQRKNSQAKLITVVHGAIYDVCVDLRKKSKTYGEKFSIRLSQNSNTSIIIPAGFAHGFLCLTKNCVLYYKCSKYRDKNSEVSILWNDPDLKINWPVKKPILSEKDQKGILLKNF